MSKVNHVIKGHFYKGIVGKMTFSWSFFHNFFVKLHGIKREPHGDCVRSKSVL